MHEKTNSMKSKQLCESLDERQIQAKAEFNYLTHQCVCMCGEVFGLKGCPGVTQAQRSSTLTSVCQIKVHEETEKKIRGMKKKAHKLCLTRLKDGEMFSRC